MDLILSLTQGQQIHSQGRGCLTIGSEIPGALIDFAVFSFKVSKILPTIHPKSQ